MACRACPDPSVVTRATQRSQDRISPPACAISSGASGLHARTSGRARTRWPPYTRKSAATRPAKTGALQAEPNPGGRWAKRRSPRLCRSNGPNITGHARPASATSTRSCGLTRSAPGDVAAAREDTPPIQPRTRDKATGAVRRCHTGHHYRQIHSKRHNAVAVGRSRSCGKGSRQADRPARAARNRPTRRRTRQDRNRHEKRRSTRRSLYTDSCSLLPASFANLRY